MRYYRTRIIVSLLVSFLLSFFLKENLFLYSTPKINTQAVAAIKNFPAKIASVITMKKMPETNNKEEKKPTPTPTLIPPIPWPSVNTQAPSPTRRPNQPVPTYVVEPTEYIPPTTVPTEPEITEYIPPAQNTPTTPAGQPNATMADFGKCLTAKGMVVYTLPTCSGCAQQKKILGEAWPYVKEVSCPSSPKECATIGVRGYPSWAKNGTIVIPAGAYPEQLADVSGCQAPK